MLKKQWAAFLERLEIWFPERQLYLRSNGNVHFIVLSPTVQKILTSALIVALIWSVFVSFGYFRKASEVADKETNISNLLNQKQQVIAEMDNLQNHFDQRTTQIESRQAYIEALIESDPVFSDLINNPKPSTDTAKGPLQEVNLPSTVNKNSESSTASSEAKNAQAPVNASDSSKSQPVDVAPAEKKADQTSDQSGDNEKASSDENEEGNGISPTNTPVNEDTDEAAHAQSIFKNLDRKLVIAEERQKHIAANLKSIALNRMDQINAMLESTGVTSQELAEQWTGPGHLAAAQGGPYLPLAAPFDIDIKDTSQQLKSDADLLALNDILVTVHKAEDAMMSIPTVTPPAEYYISSKFGRRIDPFKKNPSYHWGLDMASWPGVKVRAATSGTVVKSGWKAAYGNMIEIDHGNGFRTRYGHMRKLLVKKGQTVTAGQNIGEIGCSGRCTSPHLHYEVWFKNKPRNPLPFIQVAENVLKSTEKHTTAH